MSCSKYVKWTHNEGNVSVCWYSARTQLQADYDCIFCLSAKHRIRAGRPELPTEVATFDAQCEFLSFSSYLDAVVLAATIYMLKLQDARIPMAMVEDIHNCALLYYGVHA
jgi:hypothetical protein